MGYAAGFRPIFHFFWLFSFLLIWTSWPIHAKRMNVSQFFDLKEDLTKVTWAHAVNSKAKLKAVLKNNTIMMIEADILMGKKIGQEDEQIPIMAHPVFPPPKTGYTSDLSFTDFLNKVADANKLNNSKGVKLDFKDIDSMDPALKLLKKMNVKFPVWINADIFQGPVNAPAPKIDSQTFLETVKNYTSWTLSIGWTTKFGYDDSNSENPQENSDQPIRIGKYTKEHITEALKFLDNAGIDASKRYVTFPVRAGIASQSVDELMDLLGKAGGHASLTLWSHENDPVDIDAINHLILHVSNERVYIDLPFSLESNTSTSSTPSSIQPQKPGTNTIPTEKSTSTSTEKPSADGRSEKDKDKNLITVDENEFDPSSNSSVHVNSSPPNSILSASVVILTSILMAFLVVFS